MDDDIRFVYLMETETKGRYKIGFSKNPEKRAMSITQADNQENITCILKSVPTQYYRHVERLFHEKYITYRRWSHREYFDFDNDVLNQVFADFDAIKWMQENQEFSYSVFHERDTTNANTKITELENQIQFKNEQLSKLRKEVGWAKIQLDWIAESFRIHPLDEISSVDDIRVPIDEYLNYLIHRIRKHSLKLTPLPYPSWWFKTRQTGTDCTRKHENNF